MWKRRTCSAPAESAPSGLRDFRRKSLLLCLFLFPFLTRVTRSFQVLRRADWVIFETLQYSFMFLWDTLREQRNKRTRRIWSNPLAVRQQCCPLYRDKGSTKTRNYCIFWEGLNAPLIGLCCFSFRHQKKLLEWDQNQQKIVFGLSVLR